MIRKRFEQFRDRLKRIEEDLKRELPRRRGYGSAGVKRNKNLYKDGGEFKSRF